MRAGGACSDLVPKVKDLRAKIRLQCIGGGPLHRDLQSTELHISWHTTPEAYSMAHDL